MKTADKDKLLIDISVKIERVETCLYGVENSDDRGLLGDIREIKALVKETNGTVKKHERRITEQETKCKQITGITENNSRLQKMKRLGIDTGRITAIVTIIYILLVVVEKYMFSV